MKTSDREPPRSMHRLVGMVLLDLARTFKPLVVFEACFKGAVVGLGMLGTAWVIAPLVESTGHAAVTNTDISRFLLSPAGSLAAILLAFSFLVVSMAEHVGIIAIAATRLGGGDVGLSQTLRVLRGRVASRTVVQPQPTEHAGPFVYAVSGAGGAWVLDSAGSP